MAASARFKPMDTLKGRVRKLGSPRKADMLKFLTFAIAPIFAAIAVSLTLVFPSPVELVNPVDPMRVDLAPIDIGASNVQTAIADSTHGLPGVRAKAVANADCFEGLDKANHAKLERCGETIIEILAEIEKHQQVAGVRQALDQPEERLVEKLRLAATEVCRVRWASEPFGEYEFDSPACEVAQVSLVTAAQ